MAVVYIVFPLALVLSSLAVVAFIWAVRRGQLDDTVTPPVRILLDDPDATRAGSTAGREVRVDAPRSERRARLDTED
jgi:cbb3-type cytochrome oxidase maturation protein